MPRIAARWRRRIAYKVRHETTDGPRNSVDRNMVLVPIRQAVLDLVAQFEYRAVVLQPQISDHTGLPDYKVGKRRAFPCAKQTRQTGLPVEGSAWTDPTHRLPVITRARWLTHQLPPATPSTAPHQLIRQRHFVIIRRGWLVGRSGWCGLGLGVVGAMLTS
jgi:hypothetical protein